MATIDNLEELDNKTLREKCIEFGLPNVPITDTSRKLLIRRLRNVMAGGDAAKTAEKPKSRRETVHIIKVDREEDIKETAKNTPTAAKRATSRRTIGAPTVREEEPEPAPSRASVTQRRRSNRTTPISELEPVAAFTSKRNYSDVIEESDDDVIPVATFEKTVEIPRQVRSSVLEKKSETPRQVRAPILEKKSETPRQVRAPIFEKNSETPRQTRAPSLSKSPVVTTSYVRDTPDRSVRDEEELYEDDDFDEDDYEPEIEIIQEPIKNKHISSSRSYDISKPFASLGNKESASKPAFGLDSGRFGSPAMSRMTLSKAPTSTFSLDSTATRRYTTGGGFQTAASSNENKTFSHRSEYKEAAEVEALEPQYLSDFARRLSRLKAEPLPSPLKPEMETPRQVPRYYPTSVTGRRNVGNLNDSVGDSFKKFVIALDRKYNLRRNFIIVAIVLALMFIYILFF